jgi:hypothetical protein
LRFNSNGRSRTNITDHEIFLSIVEAKAHWRAILTNCLKNWMQKNKDKWFFDRLSRKRWAHSLMKQFISHMNVPCTSMVIKIKWCPSWSLLYLRILAMALSFATRPIGQPMTLES